MKLRKGFTIVEVLLVVTIFSVLSLAIYSTFVSGLRLWDRIQDEALPQRAILLNMERLSADLRQSPDFPKIGFSGGSQSISFPVILGNDIYQVTYALQEKTILRSLQSFKDILENNQQSQAKNFLAQVEDLKFSFGFSEEGRQELSYKDAWAKEDGVPKTVKIELKTEDVQLSRQVILPVS